MKILSVNIGLPREVEYNGKMIETSIFKAPLKVPVEVNELGIVADHISDLKNHGKEHQAVYAFSHHHYIFWESHLEEDEFSYGKFGENLTIDLLEEDKIFIGNRYLVGTCVLEVSQPRVPCYKLGIALGDKEAPKLFNEKADTGCMFRVIEEGTITEGDELDLIYESELQISIKKLYQSLLHDHDETNKPFLEKTLKEKALSPQWVERVSKRIKI